MRRFQDILKVSVLQGVLVQNMHSLKNENLPGKQDDAKTIIPITKEKQWEDHKGFLIFFSFSLEHYKMDKNKKYFYIKVKLGYLLSVNGAHYTVM